MFGKKRTHRQEERESKKENSVSSEEVKKEGMKKISPIRGKAKKKSAGSKKDPVAGSWKTAPGEKGGNHKKVEKKMFITTHGPT